MILEGMIFLLTDDTAKVQDGSPGDPNFQRGQELLQWLDGSDGIVYFPMETATEANASTAIH